MRRQPCCNPRTLRITCTSSKHQHVTSKNHQLQCTHTAAQLQLHSSPLPAPAPPAPRPPAPQGSPLPTPALCLLLMLCLRHPLVRRRHRGPKLRTAQKRTRRASWWGRPPWQKRGSGRGRRRGCRWRRQLPSPRVRSCHPAPSQTAPAPACQYCEERKLWQCGSARAAENTTGPPLAPAPARSLIQQHPCKQRRCQQRQLNPPAPAAAVAAASSTCSATIAPAGVGGV